MVEAAMPEAGPLLAFAGPRRPILVSGAGALLPYLPRFLPEWPYREVGGETVAMPDIRVSRTPQRLQIEEGNPPRAASEHESALDAANAFTGALLAAYVEQDEALLCLHAAAAELGPGLAVLIGDTEAGKSSLAVELARAGFRSFGDDRLLVRLDDGTAGTRDLGIAVGLPLKLRLPLPLEAPAALGAFVAQRTAARTPELVQLRLEAGEAAPFGASAPLRALVMLERKAGAAERLEPASPAAILRALLAQGYAPRLGMADRVAALAALARRVAGFRLVYAESHRAALHLAARLGESGGIAGGG
jgi:hypothetical protein